MKESMNDICCVGHVTLDKIITTDDVVYMPGGTSFYFAYAINRLPKDVSFSLVTSLADKEMGSVDKMREAGIDVTVFPSKETVFFENSYGKNVNERKQRVLAKADPFTIEQLKTVDAKIYHIGSLLNDDFSTETIKYLSTKGKISIDVQGFLREVRGEKVYPIDWKDKMEVLGYTDYLKVNESEMETITGITDPRMAALILNSWGVKEVIITLGDAGSLIYVDEKFYEIPAYKPRQVKDVTGCGDTYAAGYLYCRTKGIAPDEAGRFAAAMCTIKLEHNGPFDRSIEDIYKCQKYAEVISNKCDLIS